MNYWTTILAAGLWNSHIIPSHRDSSRTIASSQRIVCVWYFKFLAWPEDDTRLDSRIDGVAVASNWKVSNDPMRRLRLPNAAFLFVFRLFLGFNLVGVKYEFIADYFYKLLFWTEPTVIRLICGWRNSTDQDGLGIHLPTCPPNAPLAGTNIHMYIFIDSLNLARTLPAGIN